MSERRVVDAGGHEWTLRRRLFLPPRWRRFGPWLPDPLVDVGTSIGDTGFVAGLALALAFVVLVVLSFVVVIPALVFAAELLVGFALLAWRVGRRRWYVIAETTGRRVVWSAGGRDPVAQIAAGLEGRGVLPSPVRTEAWPIETPPPSRTSRNVRVLR